jgi:hypothetical protein
MNVLRGATEYHYCHKWAYKNIELSMSPNIGNDIACKCTLYIPFIEVQQVRFYD